MTSYSYTERIPRPSNPKFRPAYQGSNPVADIFSMWALQTTVKCLPRISKDLTDFDAMRQMALAASFAGIGFGNAGVHLCHGISYPVSTSVTRLQVVADLVCADLRPEQKGPEVQARRLQCRPPDHPARRQRRAVSARRLPVHRAVFAVAAPRGPRNLPEHDAFGPEHLGDPGLCHRRTLV